MATLVPAAKMRRVLEFLIGLRDDRVLAALGAHGFTQQDRAIGWDLMRDLGMTQAPPPPATMGSPALSALDAWRTHWFGVARASLGREYPQVLADLFMRIDKPNQSSLSAVTVLVARLDKLERAKDAATRSALEKLHKRGLTSERLAEARRLLEDVKNPARVELPDPAVRRAAIRRAETALWDYYLEWSQLARAVIKDERLLILLGYRSGGGEEQVGHGA